MPSILLLESSGRARRQILDTAARDATHMIVISHIGVKPFLAAGALKFPRHARPTSSRGPDQRQEANRHSSALQGLSVVGGSLGVYPSVNYVASCVALRIVTIPNILVRTCSVNPPLIIQDWKSRIEDCGEPEDSATGGLCAKGPGGVRHPCPCILILY